MRPRREDMGGINRRWNDGERVNHREKKRNISFKVIHRQLHH